MKFKIASFFYRFLRIGKIFLIVLGSFAFIGIVLAFTSAPFWIWYGLGTSNSEITDTPDYIVVLGGSGIPSETGLMRTYYATEAANHFPDAMVIIALPGDTTDALSSVNRMKAEMVLRGIAPERILLEDSGTNTRAQALMIKDQITNYELRNTDSDDTLNALRLTSHDSSSSSLFPRPSSLDLRPSSLVLLITSPEHLYRAVLTFRKAGFEHVYGLSAFESDIESDISFAARKLGGRRWVPDVGTSITLRYQFWTQLHYEILIIREWVAISYYWLMGWI
ncbi:MAG: YdcF family protein [Bacteroidia bacterium]|nr:YdcF family protein [Bacteroidia bacterium]